MITNLYFVRHGHSTYSPDELNRPLSERGIEDAKKVTEILKNESIHVLISSPYKRAIQTIEGLTGIYGIDIVIEEEFKERLLSEKPLNDFDSAIAKDGRTLLFLGKGENPILLPRRGEFERLKKYWNDMKVKILQSGHMVILWF